MEEFSSKINRLTIESNNESIFGYNFIADVNKKLDHKIGSIFGIVELFGLPDEFTSGFSEIISDLETEYYLPPLETEYGVEKRFEECLQRANRRIDKLIQGLVVKIELKNINTLIGLMHHDRIYLSQIGKNNAFLFHQSKKHTSQIIDIFSQTAEKRQKLDQTKMFSNVVSGKITNRDALLFCNDMVLEFLSQNELAEVIQNDSSFSSIEHFENLLRAQSENDNFYIITVQPLSQNEDMNYEKVETAQLQEVLYTPPQTSIDKLIGTQESTEKYLTPSLKPNWKKALILIWNGIKKSVPYVKKSIIFTIKTISKSFSLIIGKFSKSKTPEPIEETASDYSEEIKIEPEIISEEPEARGIQEETKEQKINLKDSFSSIKNQGIATSLSNWLNRQIAKFIKLKKFQQILLIVAFILIFFFSQSIVWQGRTDSNNISGNVQNTFEQIEELINTAEAKNIFNDEDGSRDALSSAKELITQIPDKKKYQEEKANLQSRIDDLNMLLQKITYIENLKVISDLGNKNSEAQISGLAKIGDIIFTVDNQNHNLYKIDLEKKQTLSTFLGEKVGNIIKSASLGENNIILLNDRKEFYQYDLENDSMSKIIDQDDSVIDFDVYGGKIYTLRPSDNQIYKHLPVSGGWNGGTPWINDESDISGGRALAIDGGLYMLNNNQIEYFERSIKQAVDFTAMNKNLESPTQIFTNGDSDNLYILDPQNQKVSIFDKDGDLKIQYTSKEFSDIKSIVVNEKERKIYLLSGSKIFEIEIIL